jgi:hypothetical protein
VDGITNAAQLGFFGGITNAAQPGSHFLYPVSVFIL